MSIYLVKISEWFPLGEENHETAYSITKIMRCVSCGKRVRWKAAIGHHSLPWGYGDLFCGFKCANSGKVAKEDKRRNRRMKRKFKGFVEVLK